ncbi:MAG: transglutaminase domain-containing protein [Eubacteriales bacterium]|nr:transglutaminase domain-containing protein [Eubacteriales bacterium]
MTRRNITYFGTVAFMTATVLFVSPLSARADESAPAVIYSGNTGTVQAGPGTSRWIQDDTGWWFRHTDGGYTTSAWEEIGGKWYYFDQNGYMLADSWVDTNDKRYRVGGDGAMLTSQEIEVDGVKWTIAEDGSAQSQAPVVVKSETEQQAEAIAASVLSRITSANASKRQKAEAIYNYVRGSMTYSHSGPKGDPAAAALYGFRRHYGNCYEYYAMSKYLLEAAGMPNVMVTRASDGDHFWNLVNVDGAWYHFDTTPRRTGGRWCLVTTGSLRRNSWGAHNFNVGAYPATP